MKKSVAIFGLSVSLSLGLLGTYSTMAMDAASNWKNPGGMWRPQDMAKQQQLLKELGVKIDPVQLSDPSSELLQSVVSLGYCSGSFISHSGLIITNHHCVASMLSYMSNAHKQKNPKSVIDYAKSGYYAKELEEEAFVGPTERIFVTLEQKDVTDRVLFNLQKIENPVTRSKVIDERIKQIVKENECAKENIKATVQSFYRNRNFTLIRQLELKNIKMVYAPPQNIGNYGGDTDNWKYPRHVADFALIRAYSNENSDVPYSPKSILKVANNVNSWVDRESLVMVAGYPGRTNRLITHHELEYQLGMMLPKNLEKLKSLTKILNELSSSDVNLKTKLESMIKSLKNTTKNFEEKLATVKRINFIQSKLDFEREMVSKMPDMLNSITELNLMHDEFTKGSVAMGINSDLTLGASANLIHLIKSAIDIVRMSIERPKPDSLRLPAYQERNWQHFVQAEETKAKQWDERIATRLLEWVVKRSIKQKNEDIPNSIHRIVDVEKARLDESIISASVLQFVKDPLMTDAKFRINAFLNVKTEELIDLKNPIIDLAFELLPFMEEMENLEHKQRGMRLESNKSYIDGLEKYYEDVLGRPLASDANSTLRITFGHVRGSTGPVSKKVYPPFTSIQDFISKNKWGDEEFEVHPDILRMAYIKNFGRYTEPFFGQIPVNFLAVVDTTGGNSGSAALNSKGELIGLLFDGMDETLYSDFHFNGEEVRSILVDIRYVLSVLDQKENANRILEEMGVTATP